MTKPLPPFCEARRDRETVRLELEQLSAEEMDRAVNVQTSTSGSIMVDQHALEASRAHPDQLISAAQMERLTAQIVSRILSVRGRPLTEAIARYSEAAQPSAVAQAPGRVPLRMYCQSQYDPDE